MAISGSPHNPTRRRVHVQARKLNASSHLPTPTSDLEPLLSEGEDEIPELSCPQSTERYREPPTTCAIACRGVAEYLLRFRTQRTSSALCAGTIGSRTHDSALRDAQQPRF